MEIKYATLCKQGKRANNEDYLLVEHHPEKNSWMGIVCDGMGGHAKGEVASHTVAESIAHYWKEQLDGKDDETKVMDACNEAYRFFNKKCHKIEMGTTMVMASIQDDTVTIAHLGDSRAYILSKGEKNSHFMTKDHLHTSDGYELIAKCFFTNHPEVVEPDVHQEKLKEGDKIILCSDGIYKCMSPALLQKILREGDSLEKIIEALDMNGDKYGKDNYSAIVLEVTHS